ncbi:hypothetical protein [Radiobacillus deserti]|uniref:Uncharacterized protein n=1 Tax=Radiobacillus deserti TaxID=2594883 RepID=A0A516KJJ7_9BACI|nr:hypothetical protein [Radiobacillus deserti]QDP41568.1 hypothetical protein FN924_16150 [Radiobacillus deserti]
MNTIFKFSLASIILFVPIFMFFPTTIDPVNAASPYPYQVLDNDDGAINSSRNGRTGTWNYGNYSNDYRGDHRINYSGGQYLWYFNSKSSAKRQL